MGGAYYNVWWYYVGGAEYCGELRSAKGRPKSSESLRAFMWIEEGSSSFIIYVWRKVSGI